MSTARGNGGNGNNNSIEFIVKPTEDLYLEGSRKSLLRVTEGQEYPCQMQKDQSFRYYNIIYIIIFIYLIIIYFYLFTLKLFISSLC